MAYLLLLVDLGGGGLDLTGTSQTSLFTVLVGCWTHAIDARCHEKAVESVVVRANLTAKKAGLVSCFKVVKWRESISPSDIQATILPFNDPSIDQIFVYHQIQGYLACKARILQTTQILRRENVSKRIFTRSVGRSLVGQTGRQIRTVARSSPRSTSFEHRASSIEQRQDTILT